MVIRSEESVSGLATDYDLEFRRSSPGVYVLSQMLEQLPSLGVTRWDMSGELYDYKLSWTKQSLSHAQFWVFHQGTKSRLLYGGKGLTDALRDCLRRSAPDEEREERGED
jgi:CelD/BcsL family acetyltransferase involved in cellulose biosynthesis